MGAVLSVAVSSLRGELVEAELEIGGVISSELFASDQNAAREALTSSSRQDNLCDHQRGGCPENGAFAFLINDFLQESTLISSYH